MEKFFPVGVTADHVLDKIKDMEKLYQNHFRKAKAWCCKFPLQYLLKCIDTRTQSWHSGKDEQWAMDEVARMLHEQDKADRLNKGVVTRTSPRRPVPDGGSHGECPLMLLVPCTASRCRMAPQKIAVG